MQELTKDEFRKILYPLLMENECYVTEPDGEYCPVTEEAIDDVIKGLYDQCKFIRRIEGLENKHS